uniref:Uncharacterized protein n=1 Tax=Trypanosoma vivax (strain Y486) TaxID=1055687 RepID=G0TYS9_TRYVY|nr:hypothetical protein, unlikely [Trypanosoma vivax Y486]
MVLVTTTYSPTSNLTPTRTEQLATFSPTLSRDTGTLWPIVLLPILPVACHFCTYSFITFYPSIMMHHPPLSLPQHQTQNPIFSTCISKYLMSLPVLQFT